MRAFAIYTAMRLGIFVACYAVLGWAYVALFGRSGALFWPFLIAIVVSSLLSWKFLAPQRERFAAVVEGRAARATAKFEEMKAKEDSD